MGPPRRFLAPVLAAACAGEAAVVEEEAVDACPLDQPLRLAAPEPGWRRDPQIFFYSFRVVGDRLLYSFDPRQGERDYWLVDRCGGAPEHFATLSAELIHLRVVNTTAGPVIYALDDEKVFYLVDRVALAGVDGPRVLAGLPAENFVTTGVGEQVLFTGDKTPVSGVSGVAGLGGTQVWVYVHDGDPEHAVRQLGELLVRAELRGEQELLLDELGVLREVAVASGKTTVLQTKVRSFDLAPDDRWLVWQELGDDVAEQVYLRDLEGGEERVLTINAVAGSSWGREPKSPRAGRWLWTQGSEVALQVGGEEVIVGAFRSATGEALSVPEHTSFGSRWEHEVVLIRETEEEHVELVWEPDTGLLREWFRGPSGAAPVARRGEGEALEYFLPDRVTPGEGSLWRVDLASGAAARVLPWVDRNYERLADGRYLVRRHDLALADPNTQVYTSIAEQADAFLYFPDQGVVYFDSEGPEPGLWVAPLPGR